MNSLICLTEMDQFMMTRHGQDQLSVQEMNKAVIAQYNDYTIFGQHVSGEMTCNENVADIGGICVGYDALMEKLKDIEYLPHDLESKNAMISPEQWYFMSWAQTWRATLEKQTALQDMRTSHYPPNMIRAYAPLRNIEAFHVVFNVQSWHAMYLSQENRYNFWKQQL